MILAGGQGWYGSPACAGIDRRRRSPDWRCARFPRLRGDRPEGRTRFERVAEVPPPARGSTSFARGRTQDERGSPACAGIDRWNRRPTTRPAGFPRLRGDRPQNFLAMARDIEVPPPARGSTQPRDGRLLWVRGSPACAGIDPPSRAPKGRSWRFPRLRGDRPEAADPLRSAGRVPPPARGSTAGQRGKGRGRGGSPACAGIDPTGSGAWCRGSRFPRLRGDRPQDVETQLTKLKVPPPARGSTFISTPMRGIFRGSPACAGIDPAGSTRSTPRSRFPRLRGDRPLADALVRSPTGVPPPARGSTRIRELDSAKAPGSPACAGIDRWRPGRSAARRGFPRLRGDRPSQRRP